MELTEYNKEWLYEKLQAGPVVVKFTKRDGSERVMPCTTNSTIIMFKNSKLIENMPSNKGSDHMVVFDLEKNEWRSFLVSSVKSVKSVK